MKQASQSTNTEEGSRKKRIHILFIVRMTDSDVGVDLTDSDVGADLIGSAMTYIHDQLSSREINC